MFDVWLLFTTDQIHQIFSPSPTDGILIKEVPQHERHDIKHIKMRTIKNNKKYNMLVLAGISLFLWLNEKLADWNVQLKSVRCKWMQ